MYPHNGVGLSLTEASNRKHHWLELYPPDALKRQPPQSCEVFKLGTKSPSKGGRSILSKPMRKKIGGHFYELVFTSIPKDEGGDRDFGECQHPSLPHKKILLDKQAKKTPFLFLSTLLHEALHAACWSLDEEYVESYADDVAKIILECGEYDMSRLDKIPYVPYNEAKRNEKRPKRE